MKKIFLTLTILYLNFVPSISQKNCGTVFDQAYINSLSPAALERINNFNKLIDKTSDQIVESATTTININDFILIPVVVHVVWYESWENISQEQICSQIAVLNEDYSRNNADRVNTPVPFAPVAANARIQFYLATRDPNNNPTDGITRTHTTYMAFTQNDGVKHNSTGGHDAWDAYRYLNIWVCDMGASEPIGYAQYPWDLSGNEDTDGVVIDVQAFGRGGEYNLLAPFILGRIATHEIGHWMGLKHIWGDDHGACTGSDDVSDTPNQWNNTIGNPPFPRTDVCTTTYPGIMFMNYLDYTDDAGMNLFTVGQNTRIRACFNPGGYRQNATYAIGHPISGISPVCTTRTYTASAIPQGFSVSSWQSSYTIGLTINSSGLATRQGNYDGAVTITATLTTTSNYSSFSVSRTIWVGRPVITNQKIDGYTYYNGYQICPGNHWLSVTPNGTTSYATWTVQSGITYFVGQNQLDFTLPSSGFSSVWIYANATNTCDVSSNANFYLVKKTYGCSGLLSIEVFPNPGSDEITVQTSFIEGKDSIKSELIPDEILLLDRSGTILFEKYPDRPATKIPISNMPTGEYYLHVRIGEEIIKRHIIIER